MQELFFDKIYFFKFLSMSDKPRLYQLKIITSSHSTVQVSLTAWMFSSVWENTIKEGEIPYFENKYKASPTYQARENFLFHSLTCISQIFVPNLPKCSKPRYLFYFIYSFFNVENYRKNTVYNKNSSKMLIDVNTLVKKRKQNYWT